MSTEPALDPVIHAPVRLRILVALATLPRGDALTFARLRDLLELTAGNLITHARKLEEAGYIASRPATSGRDAATEYHVTEDGLDALKAYRKQLSALLGQLPT